MPDLLFTHLHALQVVVGEELDDRLEHRAKPQAQVTMHGHKLVEQREQVVVPDF